MYNQLEEIRDRKGEKIFLFLTLENTVGVGIGGVAGLILGNTLTGSMLVGGLVGLVIGLVGLVITLDHQGLAGYERIGWLLQGRLRRMTRGSSITPDQLAGARATTRRDRPLPVDGPVRVVRRAERTLRTLNGSGALSGSTNRSPVTRAPTVDGQADPKEPR